MAWTSVPIKAAGADQLLHDMLSRYRRHCPRQPEDKQSDAAALITGASDRPRLTDHDYTTLDVLCCADAQGKQAALRVLGINGDF